MNLFDPIGKRREHGRSCDGRRERLESFQEIHSKDHAVISREIKVTKVQVNRQSSRFLKISQED
jgi:hypothetical protein